jgi:methylglutamate dehydrogenase subunit D
MLEAHSPLGKAARFERSDTTLSENAGFNLFQLSGDEKLLKKTLGKLPAKIGTAVQSENNTLFRVGPKQVWVLGEDFKPPNNLYMTPLSSGRTRIVLDGKQARAVLAACVLIDFHRDHFKPGQFAMTGIHHTPVTIHCVGENAFHIYVLRTFALNVWEWLCDVLDGLQHA